MTRAPCLLVAGLLTPAQVGLAHTADPLATAVRGIAGAVEFTDPGERIRAKAVLSPTAPIVARIIAANPQPDGSTRYRVAFIGSIAGDYDLRDLLERQDGSLLDGSPLTVRVVSQLPPDHGTDLFSESEAPALSPSRYRAIMIALAAAWLAAPAAYLIVRAMRRRPPPPVVPPPPPPTLADQLRPLVESAIAGSLSIAGRGRLELLLYLHWRERLGLTGPQAEAVSRLRRDPQAGALLRAVERWLHAQRDSTSHVGDDVAELLAPYLAAPAIDEPAVGTEGSHAR